MKTLESRAGLSALSATQTPRRLTAVARLLAWLFLIGPMLLLWVPWQQNIVGEGRLVAFAPMERQQHVDAPVSGRIVRWQVREGSRVRAGEVLLEISDLDLGLTRRLEEQRDAAAGKLKAKEEEWRSYQLQIANLEATRDLQVTTAQHRLDVARQRTRSAEESLAGARATLDSALAEQRAVQAEVDRIRADAQARIDSAIATLNKTRGELEESRASLAKIEVDLSRQRSQIVTAPRDGTVLRVIGNTEGLVVKQGDPLLVLLPDTAQRAVELWVDGNDTPLVTPGRPVRLQFEGWPAVQFGGWPEVAVGTFGGTVAFVDPTDDGKGKFRIMILPDAGDEPWPQERFLRQGGRARGWILLSRVSLAYELWRQLNAFPPLILMEGPQQDLARKRLK